MLPHPAQSKADIDAVKQVLEKYRETEDASDLIAQGKLIATDCGGSGRCRANGASITSRTCGSKEPAHVGDAHPTRGQFQESSTMD
jgi:hypothetical protein